MAAPSQPNAVGDELPERMKRHWSETQIVEIAATVALFSEPSERHCITTPLEDEPIETREKFLAPHGWSIGRHRQ